MSLGEASLAVERDIRGKPAMAQPLLEKGFPAHQTMLSSAASDSREGFPLIVHYISEVFGFFAMAGDRRMRLSNRLSTNESRHSPAWAKRSRPFHSQPKGQMDGIRSFHPTQPNPTYSFHLGAVELSETAPTSCLGVPWQWGEVHFLHGRRVRPRFLIT